MKDSSRSEKAATDSQGLLGTLTLGSDRLGLAAAQIALLQAIDESGSITAAAKKVGISYKTAWERIEALNNLSSRPLVERSAGGAGGGGTQITEYGRRIINGFLAMEAEHAAFLKRLSEKVSSLDDVARFMNVGTLKTSARNQFRGVVTAIRPGTVSSLVQMSIGDFLSIEVTITEESRKMMSLSVGDACFALIKSSSVLLSKEPQARVSARNRLRGTIDRITRGMVNSDVVINLGGSKSLSATITNESVDDLSLSVGDDICALIKASSVILMTE